MRRRCKYLARKSGKPRGAGFPARRQRVAALPPLALAQIKEVVAAGADLPLEQALALERKAFQLLFDSHDQKEGMRAFLEKRTAEYLGK
ncbi:hypothetical protein G039_0334175 [Pseudomonas aeruginosa VRFPA01]|nr:hypothetical protein G039_0334175 [Pseudomonas aeruginosa VRFPA01]